MRRLVTTALIGGALALSGAGCGAVDTLTGQEDCVILAMGGNKLCGDDARAWCDSTDSIRDTASEFGGGSDVASSQSACDTIRSR